MLKRARDGYIILFDTVVIYEVLKSIARIGSYPTAAKPNLRDKI